MMVKSLVKTGPTTQLSVEIKIWISIRNPIITSGEILQ